LFRLFVFSLFQKREPLKPYFHKPVKKIILAAP
jgi:hypothetical protein